MNIFYLDSDPRTAAEYHCDKHVVKMILETAQLLCTAHRVLDGDDFVPAMFYKATHKNHPSAVWIRSGVDQYRWGYDLFCFLLQEYNYRYGKIHACDKFVFPLIQNPQKIDYDALWSPPPQCMPDDCKNLSAPVAAYRKYYMTHKKDIARWTKREVPSWYKVDNNV